tara:strand:+ start:59 stop:643 length:585 start_codon:yes stop_codon:yes gene_type:complete
MRKFLILLILIISFQSWLSADEIDDFEIDGIGINSSLLDYLSQSEIDLALENPTYYKNNEFVVIFINKLSKTYDRLQVTFKPNDNTYKIHSVDGVLDFDRNIEKCLEQKKTIIKDLEIMFEDFERVDEDSPFEPDKSGKSKSFGSWFYLKNKGYISINCTEMSDTIRELNGWTDELSISVTNKELENFLRGDPY